MLNKLQTLVLGKQRSIGAIIPAVTIIEEHTDEVRVTDHPVDTGANVADHAIVMPAVVRCTFGWTDSLFAVNYAIRNSILKGLTSTEDVYKELQKMMKDRQPFSLQTGKRKYESVLITALRTSSTVDTENSLIIDITFEEVRLARAKTVTLAKKLQKNPQDTASVAEGGQRALLPVSGSYFNGVN